MLFNSLPFAVFLVAICLLLRALPPRSRPSLLLVASLLFYAFWIPVYLLLLVFEIAVNYALLRGMLRSPRPRLWLTTSIVFSLGLLAVFKYAAFAIATAAPLLAQAFGTAPAVPEILLPLGISFYTFQMLGLAIDSYRRDFAPVPGLARYTLFIAFFPHFIAGPILRGRDLLPQLEHGIVFDSAKTHRGIWLLACGLAKKTILADFLLAPFVDDVFAFPGVSTAPVHLVAAWSFAFQIYFDFSGYTDMARGMALLVGLELPLNFTEPYLSRNPAEFWRRWHITLSSWLRDYLYVPLGGNRRGPARTYANLMLTMLLGGLWHGAGWSFLVWGGLHGVLLVVHRAFVRRATPSDAALRWRDLPKILLLFHADLPALGVLPGGHVCRRVALRAQALHGKLRRAVAGAVARDGAAVRGAPPAGAPRAQSPSAHPARARRHLGRPPRRARAGGDSRARARGERERRRIHLLPVLRRAGRGAARAISVRRARAAGSRRVRDPSRRLPRAASCRRRWRRSGRRPRRAALPRLSSQPAWAAR